MAALSPTRARIRRRGRPARPRLRPLPFLIAAIVLSCLVAYGGYRWHKGYAREQALLTLEARGATAQYWPPAGDAPAGSHVHFWKEQIEDDDLRDLIYELHLLPNLMLVLTESGITDDGLEHVQHLDNLRGLVLENTGITDRGAALIARIHSLRRLDLSGTEITDQGVRYLSTLPQLEELSLSDTAITDDGLAAVSSMDSLTTLKLEETAVGDTGLLHLAKAESLELLALAGTEVTESGIAHLQRERPQVEILLTPTALPAAAGEQPDSRQSDSGKPANRPPDSRQIDSRQ